MAEETFDSESFSIDLVFRLFSAVIIEMQVF